MKIPLLHFVIAVVAALFSSCTAHKAYHGHGEFQPPHCKCSKLHVVEFDEQGDLWSPQQLKEARQAIEASKKTPLVVTFVHGWRHDAQPDDANLRMFGELTDQLQQELDFEVHGVYIGWRGATVKESLLTRVPTYLSFFDRRHATSRVARAPLTNALLQLSQSARNHPRSGKSVVVGHSFGGRVVEHAMSQALVTATALNSGGRGIPLPVDLIFLLNQASESLTARQLKTSIPDRKWPYDAPAIISLTSESDAATKRIWPIGLGIGRLLSFGGRMRYPYSYHGAEKRDSQTTYFMKTPGHDQRQITHRICSDRPENTFRDAQGNAYGPVLRDFAGTASTGWQLRSAAGNSGVDYVLYSKAYWVVSVPQEVLDGHNGEATHGNEKGIFNAKMRAIMSDLVKWAAPKNSQPKSAPAAIETRDLVPEVQQVREQDS
jgi:hypothetical protein